MMYILFEKFWMHNGDELDVFAEPFKQGKQLDFNRGVFQYHEANGE